MSHERRTRAAQAPIDEFIARLNELRSILGVSYKKIEERSARMEGRPIAGAMKVTRLPASTLQYALATGCQLPRWGLVAPYVVVMRALAEEAGEDLARIGSLEEWKARHEAAAWRPGMRVGTPEVSSGESVAIAADAEDVSSRDDAHGEAVDLLCHLTAGEVERDRLRRSAEAMPMGWWWGYRDVVPDRFRVHLSLEPAASLIRAYETHVIPDLLQIPAYAEAVIRQTWPDMIPSQIERRHALMSMRRQVLHRPNPVKLWAILDEAALHPSIGVQTMRAQIAHLLTICELPNVSLQVNTAEFGDRALPGSPSTPITLLRFPQEHFPDAFFSRDHTGVLCPSVPGPDDYWDGLWDRLAIEARSPAESVKILRQVLDEL
jgi:Domain of unknown function (DUF5753)